MSLSKVRRLSSFVSLFALTTLAFAAFAGCESSSPPDTDSDPEAAAGEDSAPEMVKPPPSPVTDPCGIAPDCDPSIDEHTFPISPSLVVTRNTESIAGIPDAPMLDAKFQLVDVVRQLITQAGASESEDEWLQRLWDTQNPAPGVFTEAFQPRAHRSVKRTQPGPGGFTVSVTSSER